MRELILERIEEMLRYEVDGQTYYADNPEDYSKQNDLDLLNEYEEMLLDKMKPHQPLSKEDREKNEAIMLEVFKEIKR